MRICPKCGHKDPAHLRADLRFRKKRLAKMKRARAAKRSRR